MSFIARFAQAGAKKAWVIALLLFLAAFLPRALAAGSYVTVDEQRWIERSVDFMYNLTHGDFSTIASLHPGVTATWGFGTFLLARFALKGDVPTLFQMRANNYYPLPDLLPTAALFTALVTSLTVVGGYWLLRKVFGEKVAALASLFVALDPNLLAHSRRVHLDALLASFMYLSALALLVYVMRGEETGRRRYLLLSGLFAGLAWLTKLPAIYLIPFALLALAVRYVLSLDRDRFNFPVLRRESKRFLMWAGAGCLTFYLLWPSMWVRPGFVMSELARVAVWGVDEPHRFSDEEPTAMQFFMGKAVSDPGPGYYPLISFFRMSPVTLIFFPVGIIAVAIGQKRRKVPRSRAWAFWLGLAYVVFFVVMLSLGAKKLESYVLPIFPMVDTLAAVGLVASLAWVLERWQARKRRDSPWSRSGTVYGVAIVGILAVSFSWLRLEPYYSTYFNPLLGGVKVASRLFVFGGGQGLDMAAEYLNQKEDAENLVVSSAYYDSVLRYYLRGTATSPGTARWPGSWLLSDYAILYFSYAQRGLPSQEAVDLLEGLEPEYVASINGTEYAKVYRVPAYVSHSVPTISHPAQVNLGDKVTFLGYDLPADPVPSGSSVDITLYWQCRQPMAVDYSAYLRLVNGVDHVWGQQDTGPLQGLMPTSRWDEGMVIADVRHLQVLPGTPPGVYQIDVGMYDSLTGRVLEPRESDGELVLGPVEVERGLAGESPSPAVPLAADLDGQVELLGYDLQGQPSPGSRLHLALYWRALTVPRDNYKVFVHVVGDDGTIWGQKDSEPVTGYYPTTLWTDGELVRDQTDVQMADDAPGGPYRLVIGMYLPGTNERLPVLDERGRIVGDSVPAGTIGDRAP
jgi:4-amino-4-deoxy-L-arabinose transferase-like glycosyltransferase